MTKNDVYRIGNVIINMSAEGLRISLTKRERIRSIIFLFLTPLVAIGAIFWLSGFPIKVDSFEIGVYAILLLLIVAVFYINSYIKLIKNFRNIFFDKKLGVIQIRNKNLYSMVELENLIIQPKISMYGFGTSCTIGITVNGRKIPISFAHSPKEAISIANIIATFFGVKVIEKKTIQFSFLTKW